MHHFYIFFQQKENISKIPFFSDTEYRKLLSESYEYEYEEYPDQDNYGSNKPQVHDPSSRNRAIFVSYTVSIVPSSTSRV